MEIIGYTPIYKSDYKKTQRGLIFLIISFIISKSLGAYYLFNHESYSYPVICMPAFFSFIIFLIGFTLVYQDRVNFFEKHRKYVEYSVFFYIGAFFVGIFGWHFNSLASGTLMAIAYSFMVFWLVDRTYKRLLYLAIILSVVSGIFLLMFNYHWHTTYQFDKILYLNSYIASLLVTIVLIIVFYKVCSLLKSKPEIYERQIRKESLIRTGKTTGSRRLICPFCNGKLESGWRVCHHCKKVLPKKN